MKEREKFKSRLGFILVSAGCAIGLGNIWKFPYICGQYGGAAFILLYLLFLVFLGLPILIVELSIGRGSGKSIAKAYEELEPKGEKWHFMKWSGIAGNYLLMMFYTMVCGWMMNYAVKAIGGRFAGLSAEGVGDVFGQMLDSKLQMIAWTLIACFLALGVCVLGLQKGIEKITKIMMSILIVLMIVLAIHSLTLKNAAEGIKFYLVPNFERLAANGIGEAIFAAMTHAFFTLSLGVGSMEIFGSYLSKERAITKEAVSIVILDTFVALTAGFIIIPACFAYGVEPTAGPSLLFISLPNVFNNMFGGRVWGSLFFIFMTFAAFSTVIAVYENIISFYMDGLNFSRKKAVLINLVLIPVLSMPAVLGFNLLSFIEPFGAGTGIMDLEDFLVSYNALPLGALVFVLFAVRKNGWGFDRFLEETNTGEGMKLPKAMKVYMSYILPAVIVFVYFKGYWDMFAKYSLGARIGWMAFAVALVALIFVLASGVLNRKKS